MGGIEVIDAGYAGLLARAQAVLGADPRVRSVGVGGSVGTGTADAWSDLDLDVIAHPEHHAALLADWPSWLAEITPTAFARTPIMPFIINTVTDTGLTLDIVVWSGEKMVFPPQTQHTAGLMSGVRYDRIEDALEYAVSEQLRGMAGPFVSHIQRGEHIRHLTGVPHLLGLLTTVFLAETGGPPPGKHWNESFTEEQRAAVAAIPPAGATAESLIAFGMGCARLLLERSRPQFERFDLPWPAELAAVAAERVRSQLGIETGDWLF